MIDVTREAFEEMVVDAIEALPPAYRKRMSNIDVVVEDWATRMDVARTGAPQGSTLLGVYRGVPLTRRNSGYQMTLPDQIALFRGPLQRMARDEDDLRERVAHVVRHEVAHHFGISDDRLREIDAY